MSLSKGNIYIVEDDQSFRKSTVRLVRSFGYEVFEFDSAEAFLAETDIRYPGCLVLDIRLPDIDGMDLQVVLQERGCTLPIVFMTGHGDIPMGVKAMKRGAVDFLPKPFDPDELQNAILKALARNSHEVQIEQEREEIKALIETLTPREFEVMRWVITGMLNKQIAYELGTSEKTIKVHRGRVMQKTKVSSVAELVRLAEKVDITPAA